MSRVDGLQMLRGVAAVMVAGFHIHAGAVGQGMDPGWFVYLSAGDIGVDIFFVLSGFVIFHSALAAPGRGAGSFLTQRFLRIVPPYWLALLVGLLLATLHGIHRGDWTRLPDAGSLAVSVLLLPFPGHFLAVAWTLAIEWMFYLLFALTFFRKGAGAALLMLAVWSVLGQAARLAGGGAVPGFALILHPGVVEFLFGGVVALYGRRLPRGRAPGVAIACALLLVTFCAGLWGGGLPREWIVGLPAAGLVWALVAGDWPMPRWSVLLGEASYALYLLHLAVFEVVAVALSDAGFVPYARFVPSMVMVSCAVLVAILVTIWLERPYLAACRRVLRPA